MLAFMWWIVIGLVAGLIARFLVPGKQAMGWLMTIALGLAGSIIGGFVSAGIFGEDPADPGFQPAGLVMSTVGALILLSVYVYFKQRRPRRVP